MNQKSGAVSELWAGEWKDEAEFEDLHDLGLTTSWMWAVREREEFG